MTCGYLKSKHGCMQPETSKLVTSGELYLQTSEPMCQFVGIKSFWYVLIYLESFKLQTHTHITCRPVKKCGNEEFLVNLSEF